MTVRKLYVGLLAFEAFWAWRAYKFYRQPGN